METLHQTLTSLKRSTRAAFLYMNIRLTGRILRRPVVNAIMLVALAVFSLSSVLRTTVEFFTEQSWSYQYNGVTINQLTSILIWIALPVVSVTLSLMFKVLKGRQHINVGKIMVLLSIVVIPYHVWMIKYIHSKWASTLPDYIQLLLAINILTYFVFTFCQMEFIIANLDCVRDTAVLLRPKWPSILSILYNLAMSIHLLSIVASYGSEIYYRLDLLILLLLEIEHRVVAILTFSRLLWYHIPAGNTQTLPIEIQMADLPFNRTDLAIVRMNVPQQTRPPLANMMLSPTWYSDAIPAIHRPQSDALDFWKGLVVSKRL